MKAYQKYKTLNLNWIYEIPDTWSVKKIKHLGELNSGAGFPDDEQGNTDGNIPFYKVSDMNLDENSVFMKAFNNAVTEEIANNLRAKIIEPNSIVFPKVGAALLTNKRRITTVPCCVDNNVMALTTHNGSSTKFLYYVLLTKDFSILANPGAVPSINASQVAEIQLAYPSLPEQQAIADFLDRKTAQIDTLIKKKQRQIELLQEQRTALINHAVTKGLNPNVKMKDSGVEWLGEIPSHWEVLMYKHVTTRVVVGIAEAATHAYADIGIPIIRTTNVKPNRLETDDMLYIEEWFADKNESKYLYPGDIITARTGTPGTSAVIPENMEKAQCFTMLISTLKQGELPDFYSYYINSDIADIFFNLEAWGTAQKNISVPILQSLPVVRPPLEEQKKIVDYIRAGTEKIDILINKHALMLEKIQEYRTALISEAVTGKIDVRKAE